MLQLTNKAEGSISSTRKCLPTRLFAVFGSPVFAFMKATFYQQVPLKIGPFIFKAHSQLVDFCNSIQNLLITMVSLIKDLFSDP